jgi:flagellar biosynthesis protein FlhF
MIVRSYTGRTVPEALDQVRNDLGTHALIIETRPVREPGLFGRRTGFEVVAAVDQDRPAPIMSAHRLADWTASALHTPPSQAAGLVPPPAPVPAPAPDGDLAAELLVIRRQLARLAAGSGTPCGHLGEAATAHLEDVELPAAVVAELDTALAAAGDRLPPERRDAFLAAVLARGLGTWAPIAWPQVRTLLMVGPTGVGKTTTLAKLAGQLVLDLGRRVVLVTLDTYRVGAQDQLKAYADLLDIPCDTAATPAQLGDLLRAHAGADHILIDTAGRSPADAARVHELRGFIRAAPGIDVCLAIAANAGRAECASVVERFSTLPIGHAVVTKLDECAAPGRLYGCLRRHRLPVRWCTHGQEVPADITPADPADLARRVLAPSAAAAA